MRWCTPPLTASCYVSSGIWATCREMKKSAVQIDIKQLEQQGLLWWTDIFQVMTLVQTCSVEVDEARAPSLVLLWNKTCYMDRTPPVESLSVCEGSQFSRALTFLGCHFLHHEMQQWRRSFRINNQSSVMITALFAVLDCWQQNILMMEDKMQLSTVWTQSVWWWFMACHTLDSI